MLTVFKIVLSTLLRKIFALIGTSANRNFRKLFFRYSVLTILILCAYCIALCNYIGQCIVHCTRIKLMLYRIFEFVSCLTHENEMCKSASCSTWITELGVIVFVLIYSRLYSRAGNTKYEVCVFLIPNSTVVYCTI